MKINEAIIKASDEGYPNMHFLDTGTEGVGQYRILLDPSFWQCLGKSLGWDKIPNPNDYDLVGGWRWQWHKFIDGLTKGKSIDSYFDTL